MLQLIPKHIIYVLLDQPGIEPRTSHISNKHANHYSPDPCLIFHYALRYWIGTVQRGHDYPKSPAPGPTTRARELSIPYRKANDGFRGNWLVGNWLKTDMPLNFYDI